MSKIIQQRQSEHLKAHKEAVIQAFGSIANFYDTWYLTPLGEYVWTVESSAISALFPSLTGAIALDIGTGTGMSMELLLQQASFIVGIDLSWRMLRVAQKKMKSGKRTSLVLADAESLPIRQNVVDAVLCMTVLEFVPRPLQMLNEIHRVLRHQGHLVLGVLSSSSIWAIERRLRNLVRPDVFTYARFPSPWHINRMLRQTKFVAVEYQGSVFAPSITPACLLSTFAHLDRQWGRRRIIRSFGAFLVFRAQCILAP